VAGRDLREGQEWYGASEGIYGSFTGRADGCGELVNPMIQRMEDSPSAPFGNRMLWVVHSGGSASRSANS